MINPTPIDQLASSYMQIETPQGNKENTWVKYVILGVVVLSSVAITYAVLKQIQQNDEKDLKI